MLSHRLSKAYTSAIGQAMEGQQVKLHLPDTESMLYLITTYLQGQLEGEQSVRVSDVERLVTPQLEASLEEHGMAALLCIDLDRPIPENLRAKWRSLVKKGRSQSSPTPSGQWHWSLVNRYFDLQCKPIFGNRSWAAMRDILAARPPQHKRIWLGRHEVAFSYDQKEFWHLKRIVEGAAARWNNMYQLLAGQSLFRPSQDQNPEALKQTLSPIHREIQRIYHDLQATLHDIIDEKSQRYDEAYTQLSTALAKHSEQDHPSPAPARAKKGFGQFFNKGKSEEQPVIDAEISDNLLCQDINFEADHWLDQARTALEHWQATKQSQIAKAVKRLNKLNADSPRLAQLDEELSAVFDQLNAAQLLNFKFENTSHQCAAQIHYVEEVLAIVGRAIWVVDHLPSYLEWEQFRSGITDDENRLVEALIQSGDDEWLMRFEDWYLRSLVAHHEAPLHPDTTQAFATIVSTAQQWEADRWQQLLANWEDRLISGFDSLKKENKALWKKILQGNYTYRQVRDADPGFFDILFPIKFSMDGQADISINNDADSAAAIQLRSIASPDFTSLASMASIHSPIRDMPIAQRLGRGQHIAEQIYDFSQQLRLFLMKDQLIITTLPDTMNRLCIKPISQNFVKEILLEHEAIDRITEYIIGDLPISLWIEDKAINYQRTEDRLYQLYCLHQWQIAGIHLREKSDLLAQLKQYEKPQSESPNETVQNEEAIEA